MVSEKGIEFTLCQKKDLNLHGIRKMDSNLYNVRKGFEFTWYLKKDLNLHGVRNTWYLKKESNLHGVRKRTQLCIVSEKGFELT